MSDTNCQQCLPPTIIDRSNGNCHRYLTQSVTEILLKLTLMSDTSCHRYLKTQRPMCDTVTSVWHRLTGTQPCEHKDTAMWTQGHSHVNTRTQPCEHKDTAMWTQGHSHVNTRTQPCEHKDTAMWTQGHSHVNTRTQPCEHKDTAVWTQGQVRCRLSSVGIRTIGVVLTDLWPFTLRWHAAWLGVKHQQLTDCCPWLQKGGEGVHGRDRKGMKGEGEREKLTGHRSDRCYRQNMVIVT